MLLIDLFLVNVLAFLFLSNINSFYLFLGLTFLWCIVVTYTEFYRIYRYTKAFAIGSLVIKQFLIFITIFFSFVGFLKIEYIDTYEIMNYFMILFLSITLMKFSKHFLLKKYRSKLGGNYRRTLIYGVNTNAKALENIFVNRKDYGYIHVKTFDINKQNVKIEDTFDFLLSNKIGEIYCSYSEMNQEQIKKLIEFTNNNYIQLKFIPGKKDFFVKKTKYEYYDYIPIISYRNIPLDKQVNYWLKRMFDIFFSSLVIIFVLSWLIPIIGILIKLESKGAIFFVQKRNGLNNEEFDCFKFRSMVVRNYVDNNQTTKNDARLTKIGKFIRKTSIDELPQFLNVFLGEMSVIGPRPHMVKHNIDHSSKINQFTVRTYVKPGITGLAQVKGYRGEIRTDKDIINRVRYDLFYIENWTFLLDIKIVLLTVFNVFKGEENAY
jgi:putative colanic acid biosynthesis UDP-glucose lipid carrier transferase